MKYLFLPIAVLLLFVLSCSPKMKEDQTKENPTAGTELDTREGSSLAVDDRWDENIQADLNFLATGNEPFWSVKIDFSGNMVFSTPEEAEKLVAPVPEPVRPQDVAAVSYRAETDKGTLHVTIFREKCMDSMSGFEFPYRVRVSIKTGAEKEFTDYMGCGRFEGDYRLHDIWALVEMDGTALETSEFPKGVPTLELQMKENRAMGNGGCNQFSGQFTPRHDKLNFGPLVSTKMACPAIQQESRYLSALSGKTLGYRLEEGRLYLSNDEHQLVFKKVD